MRVNSSIGKNFIAILQSSYCLQETSEIESAEDVRRLTLQLAKKKPKIVDVRMDINDIARQVGKVLCRCSIFLYCWLSHG